MIRRARPEEVVDCRWAVLRAGRPRETALFSNDGAGFHWLDAEDGAVVAVASVLPAPWPGDPISPHPGLQLRGMAVLAAQRGTGRGAGLLLTIHRELSVPLWCNARSEVVGFYASLGWMSHGEPFEILGVGSHRRMTWSPG